MLTPNGTFDKVADTVTEVMEAIASETPLDEPTMVADRSFNSTTGNPVSETPKLDSVAPESWKANDAVVVAPERSAKAAEPDADSCTNWPLDTCHDTDPSVIVSHERPAGATHEPTILPSKETIEEVAPVYVPDSDTANVEDVSLTPTVTSTTICDADSALVTDRSNDSHTHDPPSEMGLSSLNEASSSTGDMLAA